MYWILTLLVFAALYNLADYLDYRREDKLLNELLAFYKRPDLYMSYVSHLLRKYKKEKPRRSALFYRQSMGHYYLGQFNEALESLRHIRFKRLHRSYQPACAFHEMVCLLFLDRMEESGQALQRIGSPGDEPLARRAEAIRAAFGSDGQSGKDRLERLLEPGSGQQGKQLLEKYLLANKFLGEGNARGEELAQELFEAAPGSFYSTTLQDKWHFDDKNETVSPQIDYPARVARNRRISFATSCLLLVVFLGLVALLVYREDTSDETAQTAFESGGGGGTLLKT